VLIKVCGNKYVDNLKLVLRHQPDMVGFIFYKKSARYVQRGSDIFNVDTGAIKRVGVFVEDDVEDIVTTVKACGLHSVQLHGDYDNEVPKRLKKAINDLEVIKVVPVKDSSAVADVHDYAFVDYVLFDTAGPLFGGHGVSFDWSWLANYKGSCPFLLAGGIGADNIDNVPFCVDLLAGVDVNSRVEEAPGIKSDEKLLQLFRKVRRNDC
jgi:phosphoribosylanthranilate isomerase